MQGRTCLWANRIHSAVADGQATSSGHKLALQAGQARTSALDFQQPGSSLHSPGCLLHVNTEGHDDVGHSAYMRATS